METLEQARDTIIKELTSDDSEVRGEYLKHFEADAKRFADSMAQAFIKWREFDNSIKDDEKRAHVSALVYIAITLNVLSMKVFLAGQTIAAGNLFLEQFVGALFPGQVDTAVVEDLIDQSFGKLIPQILVDPMEDVPLESQRIQFGLMIIHFPLRGLTTCAVDPGP